jgi:hypothetical protein
MDQIAARLHVLLARDAHTGVVIRRGPSKQVATIGWNRDSDEFTMGQWLKGRIYERRSDLSPDGKHLIYFAMNGKWDSETKGSWTAISLAPYMKAIGLWAKGDCWHGGGLFVDNTKFWLNNGYGHACLKPPPRLKSTATAPPGGVGSECFGVYFSRLIRDGWRLQAEPDEAAHAKTCAWVFDKPGPAGWALRKRAIATVDLSHGKGCYYDTHELIRNFDGHRLEKTDWEWADWDRQRLVWSAAGKLSAAEITTAGLANERVLFDFNQLAFEPREAPY